MRCLFLLILLSAGFSTAAQILKPGFNKEEYRQLMLISTRSTASPGYYKNYPEPTGYQMLYQSKPIGLDNLWDFWISDKNVAVISIRGTTQQQESWLGNIYAAMVPAKGKLELSTNEVFEYTLAENSKAAVHIGWLLSMAFLSEEIVPQIRKQYQQGTRDFLIMGHSQGGAIAYLLTAYLYNLQKQNRLASDIRFKTYCSAAPKPGNVYFAYEYEAATQGVWAYNVVNAADWVPEVPMSVQTLRDFNDINPFVHAKALIRKQKFPKNLALHYVYGCLSKPAKRAQRNYEQYLGKVCSKAVKKYIVSYNPPRYFKSNNYVRTGTTIVLMPDADYYQKFPGNPREIFSHHLHNVYLYLLDKLPE